LSSGGPNVDRFEEAERGHLIDECHGCLSGFCLRDREEAGQLSGQFVDAAPTLERHPRCRRNGVQDAMFAIALVEDDDLRTRPCDHQCPKGRMRPNTMLPLLGHHGDNWRSRFPGTEVIVRNT